MSELSRGKQALLAVLCSSCMGRELSCAAPELGDGLGSPGLAGAHLKGRTACICDQIETKEDAIIKLWRKARTGSLVSVAKYI